MDCGGGLPAENSIVVLCETYSGQFDPEVCLVIVAMLSWTEEKHKN